MIDAVKVDDRVASPSVTDCVPPPLVHETVCDFQDCVRAAETLPLVSSSLQLMRREKLSEGELVSDGVAAVRDGDSVPDSLEVRRGVTLDVSDTDGVWESDVDSVGDAESGVSVSLTTCRFDLVRCNVRVRIAISDREKSSVCVAVAVGTESVRDLVRCWVKVPTECESDNVKCSVSVGEKVTATVYVAYENV